MEQTKSLLASKTIWGAMLVVAATVAQMAGYELLDPAGFAEEVVALIGALLSVYGRITAIKKIG